MSAIGTERMTAMRRTSTKKPAETPVCDMAQLRKAAAIALDFCASPGFHIGVDITASNRGYLHDPNVALDLDDRARVADLERFFARLERKECLSRHEMDQTQRVYGRIDDVLVFVTATWRGLSEALMQHGPGACRDAAPVTEGGAS